MDYFSIAIHYKAHIGVFFSARLLCFFLDFLLISSLEILVYIFLYIYFPPQIIEIPTRPEQIIVIKENPPPYLPDMPVRKLVFDNMDNSPALSSKGSVIDGLFKTPQKSIPSTTTKLKRKKPKPSKTFGTPLDLKEIKPTYHDITAELQNTDKEHEKLRQKLREDYEKTLKIGRFAEKNVESPPEPHRIIQEWEKRKELDLKKEALENENIKKVAFGQLPAIVERNESEGLFNFNPIIHSEKSEMPFLEKKIQDFNFNPVPQDSKPLFESSIIDNTKTTIKSDLPPHLVLPVYTTRPISSQEGIINKISNPFNPTVHTSEPVDRLIIDKAPNINQDTPKIQDLSNESFSTPTNEPKYANSFFVSKLNNNEKPANPFAVNNFIDTQKNSGSFAPLASQTPFATLPPTVNFPSQESQGFPTFSAPMSQRTNLESQPMPNAFTSNTRIDPQPMPNAFNTQPMPNAFMSNTRIEPQHMPSFTSNIRNEPNFVPNAFTSNIRTEPDQLKTSNPFSMSNTFSTNESKPQNSFAPINQNLQLGPQKSSAPFSFTSQPFKPENQPMQSPFPTVQFQSDFQRPSTTFSNPNSNMDPRVQNTMNNVFTNNNPISGANPFAHNQANTYISNQESMNFEEYCLLRRNVPSKDFSMKNNIEEIIRIINIITANMLQNDKAECIKDLCDILTKTSESQRKPVIVNLAYYLIELYSSFNEDPLVLLNYCKSLCDIVVSVKNKFPLCLTAIFFEIQFLADIFIPVIYDSVKALSLLRLEEIGRTFKGGALQAKANEEMSKVKKLGILFGSLYIFLNDIVFLWNFLSRLVTIEVTMNWIPAIAGCLTSANAAFKSLKGQEYKYMLDKIWNNCENLERKCNTMIYMPYITMIKHLYQSF